VKGCESLDIIPGCHGLALVAIELFIVLSIASLFDWLFPDGLGDLSAWTYRRRPSHQKDLRE
jgi:hypothetical protein